MKIAVTKLGGVATQVTQTKIIQANIGIPGRPGDETYQQSAGETIGGHRVVRLSAGQLWLPSLSTQLHADEVIGITTGAVAAGEQGTVRRSGVLQEPSWNWTEGAVYCGADGALTQTPPTSGWVLAVGVATATDTIWVRVGIPVFID